MTPEEFAQLDEIFQAAHELLPTERAAYLDRVCAGKPMLRREAAALLAVDGESTVKLKDAVADAADSLNTTELPTEAGQQYGPYRLVREIGRGGMATVYQAIRTDGEFLQTVAIKLVRRGLDTENLLRRFRAERQILATLTHPNIAALLDGGTSPDGRPYLVMELIEGEPLVDYILRRDLPLRRRLILFRIVCAAVGHAHGHQVIHRDIKPANILVTKDGTPKLLDFGIAKLLLTELAGPNAPDTEAHIRLMTPDYASPEQVRGETLTPATDIYSLGVLLYEMVTGTRPFAAFTGGSGSVERAIVEETAPLASRAARKTELRQQLAGDIDTIISKAMRKEPERRYASAEEFSDDVGRYLDGEPVQARRDTLTYRASKWILKRPYVAVAALAGVIASGLALAAYLDRRESETIRRAAALSQQGRNLLADDPRTGNSGGPPAGLKESVRLFEESVSVAPNYAPGWLGLAEAAEFSIDFDPANSQHLIERAERAARRAIELDPSMAKAWEILAVIASRRADTDGALRHYETSLSLNPAAPFAVRGYANILFRHGRIQDALIVTEKALAKLPDPSNPDPHAAGTRGRAIILSHRGLLLYWLNRPAEAVAATEESIGLDTSYRPSYWVAGMAKEATGDLAGAERDLRTAVRLAPRDARFVGSLAHVLGRLGKRAEASALEEILFELHARGRHVACHVAIARAGVGDRKGAIDWVEKGQGEGDIRPCLADPRLREISTEPRIAAIRARVGPER